MNKKRCAGFGRIFLHMYLFPDYLYVFDTEYDKRDDDNFDQIVTMDIQKSCSQRSDTTTQDMSQYSQWYSEK